MHKILIADNIEKDAFKKLIKTGRYKVIEVNETNIMEEIKDADCIVIRSKTKLTRHIMNQARKLRIIARSGAGVDNIDIHHATKLGIYVMNVPHAVSVSVSELTIGLIISLLRKIPWLYGDIKNFKWNKATGVELKNKNIGVFGFGRIGREVALRLKAFEARVFVCDKYVDEKLINSYGFKKLTLKELFRLCDVVTIHVPLNDETRNIINWSVLKNAKKGIYIVNVSRGEVWSEVDVVRAIKSGVVDAIASDVYSQEPIDEKHPFYEVIDRCILTPHIGASTLEAQQSATSEIAENIYEFFENGSVKNVVNIEVDIKDFERIKPYLKVSESLGKIFSQYNQLPDRILVNDVTGVNPELLYRAFLSGYFFKKTTVNIINAQVVADEMGFNTKFYYDVEAKKPYEFLITVKSKKFTMSGSVMRFNEVLKPLITSINSVPVEFAPEGTFLFIENIDAPGMIGKIGTILGSRNINIADMSVGRIEKFKRAIMVIKIDEKIDVEALKEIRKTEGILRAEVVEL